MTVLIISTIVMEPVIVMVMMTLKMMTMMMMMMNIMILKTASLRSLGSVWQITGSSQTVSSPSPQTTGGEDKHKSTNIHRRVGRQIKK